MSTIQDIKDRVSVADVLNKFGIFHKRSRAACPLHKGENPTSFSFGRDWYRCWSCGVSGNQFSLYMSLANCDFKTALTNLARMAGVPVPNISCTPTRTSFYPENIDPDKLARQQYIDYVKGELSQVKSQIRGLERTWFDVKWKASPERLKKLWDIHDRGLSNVFDKQDSQAVFLNWKVNQLSKNNQIEQED